MITTLSTAFAYSAFLRNRPVFPGLLLLEYFKIVKLCHENDTININRNFHLFDY